MPHNAEAVQRLEMEFRLTHDLLRKNMAAQFDLQKEESLLREKLQRIENDKYRLLRVPHS